MGDILTKALCYIAIIVLGAVLRRRGFFGEGAFAVLSNTVIRITLPAAIIASSSGRRIDFSLLSICLLGFGGGVLYLLCAAALHRGRFRSERAFALLNTPGYNIGTFAMPFTQSFLGPLGVITTSLFDMGNAFVCLGGSYGVAAAVKAGNGFSIRRILSALSRSVPFLAHLLMVILNLGGRVLPPAVLSFAQIIGNANPFLAMLMIGVGFHLSADPGQLGKILRILIPRYALAAVLGSLFYFFLPFSLEVRQALVILAFSPIGSAVPGFTGELGEDVGLSSAINSISIVCSIFIMMVLLMILL